MPKKRQKLSVGDVVAFQIPEGFAYLCVAEHHRVYLMNFISNSALGHNSHFVEDNFLRPIHLVDLGYFPEFVAIGKMSVSESLRYPKMYQCFDVGTMERMISGSEYQSSEDGSPLSREEAMSMWKAVGAVTSDELSKVIMKYRDQLSLVESDPAAPATNASAKPVPDSATSEETEDTVHFEYQGCDEMVAEAVGKALATRLKKEKIEFEDDYNFLRTEASHAPRVLELLREILGKKVRKSERGDVEIVRHGPGDDDVREFSIVPMVTYGITGISSDIAGPLSDDLDLLMTDADLAPERVTQGETDLRADTPCIDAEGDRRALAAFREALCKHLTAGELADKKIYRLGPSDEISYFPAIVPEREF